MWYWSAVSTVYTHATHSLTYCTTRPEKKKKKFKSKEEKRDRCNSVFSMSHDDPVHGYMYHPLLIYGILNPLDACAKEITELHSPSIHPQVAFITSAPLSEMPLVQVEHSGNSDKDERERRGEATTSAGIGNGGGLLVGSRGLASTYRVKERVSIKLQGE